ncbi:hypothetical protein BKI52_23875 [marine bacterium AO1-C]|nr:hypothetical protein BKI52_23875 [marine bacterium AO1-C]
MIVGLLALITACQQNKDNGVVEPTRQFGIFRVLTDDTTVEMNGEITSNSLNNFNRLLTAYPKVNLINIRECGGSLDDDINLQLSALVHQKQMNIHLMDNGLIASGGTDFFLAGVKRTRGSSTRIGVHSWASGTQEATDFPKGHAEHQKYIRYYVAVGFTQQQAEDFYYFTINAAPAANIHWMTDAEITQYGILK